MKFFLQDSRMYIEKHYMVNQAEINYHNWLLYETLMKILQELNETIINPKWNQKYLLHPFNILQYYQNEN